MATTKTAKKTTTATTKRACATKKSAAAKSKTTKTTASRAGTTAKSAVKKAPATAKKSVAKKTAPAKKATAKKAAPKVDPTSGIGLVKLCVAALDDKKATGIEVIYLGEKSPVTDYYVIATGTSDPHLRALRIALEKAIHEVVPASQIRIQNEPNSGWCVVDAFDVVVHIFSEEQRQNYALEELWAEGERITL